MGEMTTTKLLQGVIDWWREDKGYGGVKTDDGHTYGIHVNQRTGALFQNGMICLYGVTLHPTTPVRGQAVWFQWDGNARWSYRANREERHTTGWCLSKDFEQAFDEMSMLQEQTTPKAQDTLNKFAERVCEEDNPLFRCLEQEMSYGRPSSKPIAVVFKGTLCALQNKLRSNPHMPLETSKMDSAGHQYIRWFEKLQGSIWVKTPNPITSKFTVNLGRLSLRQACAHLSQMLQKQPRRMWQSEYFTMYKWLDADNKLVAQGEHSINQFASVVIHASDWHLETTFQGREALLLIQVGVTEMAQEAARA